MQRLQTFHVLTVRVLIAENEKGDGDVARDVARHTIERAFDALWVEAGRPGRVASVVREPLQMLIKEIDL
jgi:hypothetical protein